MTTVVVTGAAGGIGSATVARLVRDGYFVVGIDRVAVPIGDGVRGVMADVSDSEQIASALRDAEPFDHVVAIAGGALPEEKVATDPLQIGVEVFRSSIESNLVSAWVTLCAAVPHLRTREGDRSISLTTSTDALVSYGLPAYAAAKAGIIGLVHSLAEVLGRSGIRINAVAPGDVPTARNVREWGHLPDWYADLTSRTALRRLCTPESIGEAFAAGIRLTGMTGQVLIVDGGLVVNPVRAGLP